MRRSTAGWRAVAAAPSSWRLGSRAGERLHGEAIKLIQDLLVLAQALEMRQLQCHLLAKSGDCYLHRTRGVGVHCPAKAAKINYLLCCPSIARSPAGGACVCSASRQP